VLKHIDGFECGNRANEFTGKSNEKIVIINVERWVIARGRI
jgi:hypothetical protein